MERSLKSENEIYWNERAPGYSDVNQEELAGVQKNNWKTFLTREILSSRTRTAPGENSFSDAYREKSRIHILDAGAGPGFISIILAEEGFNVTALDASEEMLSEARKNAGETEEKIRFMQGDAENPPFEPESFDVIFTRNLTWNLLHPENAYKAWLNLLKPGGLLMIFDANWYAYLFDENKKNEYLTDRKNVAENGYADYNVGENFDIMENIAKKMPLSKQSRPLWDKEILSSLGAVNIQTQENIGEILYSQKEKINYASTPLFYIKAFKRSI